MIWTIIQWTAMPVGLAVTWLFGRRKRYGWLILAVKDAALWAYYGKTGQWGLFAFSPGYLVLDLWAWKAWTKVPGTDGLTEASIEAAKQASV